MPGTLLGTNYCVISALRHGRTGGTYLAEDERLGRLVVLKVLDRHAADESVRSEMLRTARLMARVGHENVASVYDVGEQDGATYVVLEHVDGPTLSVYLAEHGPLSPDEALDVIDQLARGLEAIHRTGTSHGALHPGNVLVGAAFRIAITDFGFGEPPGSGAAYAAPERLAAHGPEGPSAGARSDLYSLGAIAQELLTGRLPEEAVDSEGRRIRPSRAGRELSAVFDPPLLSALADDPERRTKDVATFRRAMAEARARATPVPTHDEVLVVDDDPDFRSLAELCLQAALPGCRVTACSDGSHALAEAEQKAYGLALLDLHMPGLNGIELTAALRATRLNADTPILVITGRGGAADWKVLSALGADGFVVKPVDPNSLVSTVRRMVETRKTREAAR